MVDRVFPAALLAALAAGCGEKDEPLGFEAGALGGEVLAIATVSKGDTDMSAVLENFASAQPDGIFLPLFAAEGYHFVSQAKEFDKLEEVTPHRRLHYKYAGVPREAGIGRGLPFGARLGFGHQRQSGDRQGRQGAVGRVPGCCRRQALRRRYKSRLAVDKFCWYDKLSYLGGIVMIKAKIAITLDEEIVRQLDYLVGQRAFKKPKSGDPGSRS